MSCPYDHFDGAYVLGSLSPAERAAYERHLAGCADCARSVRELAGLPGLLARVPPEVLDDTAPRQPLPETLLPGLVAAVRRDRRRRATTSALLAAAATVLVIGGTALAVRGLDDGDPVAAPPATTASTAPAQRMTSLGAGSVQGWISLTEVDWGTRLDLTCTYGSGYERHGDGDGYGSGHDPGADRPPSYAMFVRTADGVEQVATWVGVPGRELQVTGATAAAVEEILSVVVRTTAGEPVLRLQP